MEKEELQGPLKFAAAALSTSDLIPALRCFAFDAEAGCVTTYDDMTAIITPCACDIMACVPGSELLTWVNTTSGDIKATCADDKVTFRSGRSKISLEAVPLKDYYAFFTHPDSATWPSCKLTPAFIERLKIASVAMGYDPSHPWRLGVTVVANKEECRIYAANNIIAMAVRVPEVRAKKGDIAVLLPPALVETLTRQGAAPVLLRRDKKMVEFVYEDGSRIISRISSDLRPDFLWDTVNQKDVISDLKYKVDDKIRNSFSNINAIAKKTSTPECQVIIKGGKGTLVAQNNGVRVAEVFHLKGGKSSHPDITTRADPVQLANLLGVSDRCVFTEQIIGAAAGDPKKDWTMLAVMSGVTD